MQVLEHEPLKASEQPALQKIERVLTNDPPVSLLVGSDGEVIELPKSVFQVLKQIVSHMRHGHTIFVGALGQYLSTQEAADILDVSRPYLIKLLDEGKIPFTRVGKHRRIHFNDLLDYQQCRDEEREQALNEMVRLSQELGLYD